MYENIFLHFFVKFRGALLCLFALVMSLLWL